MISQTIRIVQCVVPSPVMPVRGWTPESSVGAPGVIGATAVGEDLRHQSSTGDRAAALTGLRAVAALMIVGTHAAYGTGQAVARFHRSALCAFGDRCPDLLRPVGIPVVSPVGAGGGERDAASVGGPVCTPSRATHRAGLRRDGVDRLPDLRIPRRRAQPRTHVDGAARASHADADLPAGVLLRDASGPYSDLESGRRIRLLCGTAADGWVAAEGAVQGGVATGVAARRSCWPGRTHSGVALVAESHRLVAQLGGNVAACPSAVLRLRNGFGGNASRRATGEARHRRCAGSAQLSSRARRRSRETSTAHGHALGRRS